ncbi:MAG TPA: hypothetical protein VI895_04135 [Bdellovibrionota bacterium]|nr:hypothetical protein [Bdellovibrionota bacterium]
MRRIFIILTLTFGAGAGFLACDSDETTPSPSPTPQTIDYTCKDSSDCVTVIGSCCGCPYIGVNRNSAEAATVDCSCDSSKEPCVGCAVLECSEGSVVCEDGTCTYIYALP